MGQLGLGARGASVFPMQIPKLANVKSITAGTGWMLPCWKRVLGLRCSWTVTELSGRGATISSWAVLPPFEFRWCRIDMFALVRGRARTWRPLPVFLCLGGAW
ncbi:hypothetical protein [Cystobacter fuscus]|uniref:hypothetical protein n=1 Tax=Cystobacter fuscus TaxID=43 RepID=UPI0034CE1000